MQRTLSVVLTLVVGGMSGCRHATVPGRVHGDAEIAPRAAIAAVPADLHHVIVGIDSLERGMELLRRVTGLTPIFAGAHPGRGTQNALLSLGPGRYLELLAPNPADTSAAARTLGMAARLRALRLPTPIGWALGTPDADSLRSTLVARGLPGGTVTPGARTRPDGQTVRWRALGLAWGLRSAVLPFFVEDDAAGPGLSTGAPTGCELTEFALASPHADTVRTLLQRARLSVDVAHAPAERISLTLACPQGRVQLPDGAP